MGQPRKTHLHSREFSVALMKHVVRMPRSPRACSRACGFDMGLGGRLGVILLNAQMSGFGNGNLVLDQSTTGFGPQPVIPPTRPRDGSVVSSVHCMNDPQPEGSHGKLHRS